MRVSFWKCSFTWKQSARNTLWCVVGCSLGEFGTLAAFQALKIDPMTSISFMALPIINGIASSVVLETWILSQRLPVHLAARTAVQMSFISMVGMECAMEATDYCLTGGMSVQLWAVPWMLVAGFVVPLPYNYWRMKRLGKSCH